MKKTFGVIIGVMTIFLVSCATTGGGDGLSLEEAIEQSAEKIVADRSAYAQANGDDENNNGWSEDTPFKTLAKVLDAAKGGVNKRITLPGQIDITGEPIAGMSFEIAKVNIQFTYVSFPGVSVVGDKATDSLNDPANRGYRIWYSIVAPGETPPANPEELRKSFFTKQKKDLIEFEFGDSGKMVYLAAQVENDGKTGPWGPMVSALIP
jgi:hypothetical protein